MSDRIRMKQRRDTAANWAAENPILAEGEIGVVTDVSPSPMKIGDGTTAWNSLPEFAGDATALDNEITRAMAAEALLIPLTQKGAANGVATLGADSKIPTAQLPALAINEIFSVASQAAMLALTAQRGDMAVRTDQGRVYVLSTDSPGTLADWLDITPTAAMLKANNLSDLVNVATARTNLGLGTAAVKNAPAAGDAAAGETVLGNDSRLSGIGAWTDLGNLGATETITGGPGTTRREGTLNADCAITITLTNDQQIDLMTHQDATGGRATTFVGVDAWVTQSPITKFRGANEVDRYKFERIDGVTYGYWVTQPASGVIGGQDEGPARTGANLFPASVTLLDAPITIPAGLMRAGDALDIVAGISYTNNSGATRTVAIEVYIDATLVLTGTANVTASATARAVRLQASIRFEAVNDQNASMLAAASLGSPLWTALGTSAIDFASARTIDIKLLSSAATDPQSAQLTSLSIRRVAA